jgi:hypothetical protein
MSKINGGKQKQSSKSVEEEGTEYSETSCFLFHTGLKDRG